MTALPISQIDSAAISTPAGLHNILVDLVHDADRHYTFDIKVCYSPGDITALTMQLHTLSTALARPGTLVDEGRISVMVSDKGDGARFYLPMGAGFAVLDLSASSIRALVDEARAKAASEQALDAFTEEGFYALDAWLADQG